LNRQFINIMAANGIPEELFVSIFRQTVDGIKGLAKRVENGVFNQQDIQLMSVTEVSIDSGFRCLADQQFPLVGVIKAGFNKNPLILDMVEIVETRALQDLKWKARLQIPGGVFLIGECTHDRRRLTKPGVADETGTLKEGEVFCQYQESDEKPPRVVVSEVLVCRAPACKLIPT
jgi:RNA-dependent RNA polymerase